MDSNPLAVTLRPHTALPNGLPPAGPVRDRQAEKRRALANATQAAVDEQDPKRTRVLTKWTKGQASSAYEELAQSKPLPIMLKPPASAEVTASQRQSLFAAASRWHKVGKAAAIAAGLPAPPPPAASLATAVKRVLARVLVARAAPVWIDRTCRV